jgi:hypothetical protein
VLTIEEVMGGSPSQANTSEGSPCDPPQTI